MVPLSNHDDITNLPWGAHGCHFYETTQDLLDTVLPFLRAGLARHQRCLWGIAPPLTAAEAWSALRQAVPELDRYAPGDQIEILPAVGWFLSGGGFDSQRVQAEWIQRVNLALASGYSGVRVCGDAAWLPFTCRREFLEYEAGLGGSIREQRLTMLCTYPLASNGPEQMLDVLRTHQFATASRHGAWHVLQARELEEMRSEIERLNRRLARRVATRTRQLRKTNAQLRRELEERRRAEDELRAVKDRLAGELAAMVRLHDLSTRLPSSGLRPLLEAVLSATMALQNADFGDIQLCNAETGALEVVVYRALPPAFVDHFRRVLDDGQTACDRALRQGERVIIDDVHTDPGFAPHRHIADAAGIRAVQSTPMYGRTGEPLGMISTYFRKPHRPSEHELRMTDLYARQAAEMLERQRAEQDRGTLASLVENSTDFIGIASLDGLVFFVNAAGRGIVGLGAGEPLRVLHLCEYLSDAEQWRFDAEILPALMRDGRWEGETRFRHFGSARAIPMLQHVFFIKEPVTGRRIAVATSSRDITHRKDAEDALRHAHEELAHVTRVMSMGQLTASIAHEVNQPLAAIVANGNACLRWLARDEPQLAEARAAAERIVRDGTRAADIVRRIHAFMKKTVAQRMLLDVNEVVHEVLTLARREILDRSVTLHVELAPGLPPVVADRVQLQQVILNLLMNAAEAMNGVAGRPRVLRIASECPDARELLVTVRDSGPGVAPAACDRLFEAFFTTKPQGMGLGLSISRSIIEAHGGRLWASSNADDGATFFFALPAAAVQV